ncbi:MAG: M3 family oligoendopeptidase [Rhodobacteraceae bacterium]|nr:M3 family oligoendopeptidase [Paracoccaceae bacterium]
MTAAAASPLGDLPEWDLADLYAAPDAPEVARDLAAVSERARAFAADHEGRLATLDAEGLLAAVLRYEEIESLAGRLGSYAGLRHSQATTDSARAKFRSDIDDRLTDATAPLVFFALEINRIDDAALEGQFAALPALARYRPFFGRIRAFRPHQLSDELERFLHDTSAVGPAAWNKLFDETLAAMTFTVDGADLALEPTLNLLTDHDRPRRERAARALAAGLGGEIRLFARVHNTLAKEKEIVDRWRRMPSPAHGRHLANQVEPAVVEALRDAVVAAYPRLSHRYYRLKARWMGLEALEVWDRNAPLPFEAPRLFGWDEARAIVTDAYGGFSPTLAELARPFFTRGWIDAALRPGKAPGAFAHPTVAAVHPYVLVNYQGKPRDVMTLAHELGHGVHQRLAAGQGELLSQTPLTLAETASVFGEMLTFRALLAGAATATERRVLLAGKVEDMINTVVRQIAFYDFEGRLHAARRAGELTPDDIGRLWIEVQTAALGPAFRLMPGYETFWAYIPHFVHAPFYVYAYAFGDGLVNALYAVHEEGDPEFVAKYLDLLRAGGSRHHRELLAPFGLDAADPAFWDRGLGLIGRMIDELEAG